MKDKIKLALLLAITPVALSASTINVSAGGNIQSAIDSARPGDNIVLEAGKTFVGSFVLKEKLGSGWITITSDPNNKAKIVSSGKNQPAISTEPNASYYRLANLEVTKTAEPLTNLIILDGSHIILDNVYAHGDPATNLRRCVALNGEYQEVLNSRLTDCHEVGADSQAIAGWNGAGPFKIIGNRLEGAGENILFGGADPTTPGLVPSDIEIRNNVITKPLSWKTSTPHWTVKNLLELKNARRVLIEGNIFENNWADAQSGYAIVLTPRNQDGGCPWCQVTDVIFQNNTVKNSYRGFNILGSDDINHTDNVTSNIKIHNNRFENIASWWILIPGPTVPGPKNLQITSNTVDQGGTALFVEAITPVGFVFTDNTIRKTEYGIMGNGTAPGEATIKKYFPNSIIANNTYYSGTVPAVASASVLPGRVTATVLPGRVR